VSIDLRGLRWSAATRSGGGASAASSLRPSRDCRSGYGGRERSPAHDLALVRLASSSEARGAHRVAPCWLPALPPRRFDGHGVFLGVPDFRDWVPEDPLLKFASPSKPNRVSTARPQVSRWPLTQPVRGPCGRDRLSWGSCSLERCTPGAPFDPETTFTTFSLRWRCGEDRLVAGEGCHTPTGAVLRVLAPLDGSGHVRGTHGLLAEPAVRRDAPTLRGLVPCRSRPLESPFRAFPSRGAVPDLSGLCFLAGSRSTTQRRGTCEAFATSFPSESTPCRGSPEGSPDAGAATLVPRDR